MGKCLTGMTFCLKEVVDGWDHLMHAIEVGSERSKFLSIQARREKLITRSNKERFVMEWVGEERECTGFT